MKGRTHCPDTPDGLSGDRAVQGGGHTPPFRGVSACPPVRSAGKKTNGGGDDMLIITDKELYYLAEDACVDAFDGDPDAARRLEEFAAEAQQRGMPPFGAFWGRWVARGCAAK